MEVKRHRVLEQALTLLEMISKSTKGYTLAEISRELELSKSCVFSLIQTLVDMNYLQKEERTGLYFLGIKTFEVGSRYVENNDIFRAAKEVLENVSLMSNETTHLAILEEHDVVYVCKYDSQQAIRMISYIGNRVPAHATAVGKALLSGFGNDELRHMYEDYPLKKLTNRTITDLDTLIHQIENIRVTGMAYECEESTDNIQCIAVPVCNKEGRVMMAMSISVPIFRSENGLQDYMQYLINGKKQLEFML